MAVGRKNVLEVVSLVKEFPAPRTVGSLFPWAQSSEEASTFRAVDDISFELKRGESLGLVGESGCGKSTTSSIITRLIEPTSGDVIFDGQNITTYPAETFAQRPERQKIQMVFQDPTDCLNPRYSAHDCIAEPLKRLRGLRNRLEIRSKVDTLAERVGLPIDLLDRFPHQLSGGQKARVAVDKLHDANDAGTSRSAGCTLIFTEGDSAAALAVARQQLALPPWRAPPAHTRCS